MKRYFIVATKDTPLSRLMTELLPQQHRESIDTIIAAGGIWRNKVRLMNPSELIRRKETVTIHIEPGQELEYIMKQEHVVYENHHFLVVYKPGRLNVHAVPSSLTNHLTHGVNQYLIQTGVNYHATPITRLDQPVSGLVVFGKHKKAERELFRLAKEKKIRKWYRAALEKPAPQENLRFQDRISNKKNRTAADPDGKFADSLFAYKEETELANIYSVFTFTGRRHQIRFHAFNYLSPILGDRLYESSYIFAKGEIALLCCGYNIPFWGKRYKVRLPETLHHDYMQKIQRAEKKKPPKENK
jgi:23S rRNA-/tRNA-specific pseudouridylate synthase